MRIPEKEMQALKEVLASKFEVSVEDIEITDDGDVKVKGEDVSGRVQVVTTTSIEREDITEKVEHEKRKQTDFDEEDSLMSRKEAMKKLDDIESTYRELLRSQIKVNSALIEAVEHVLEHLSDTKLGVRMMNKQLEYILEKTKE